MDLSGPSPIEPNVIQPYVKDDPVILFDQSSDEESEPDTFEYVRKEWKKHVPPKQVDESHPRTGSPTQKKNARYDIEWDHKNRLSNILKSDY